MCSASETLERVAELLPLEQRERLLLIALKFRSIPEDDEFLQVLEGIGLMTLLWSKVPQEIHSILEAIKPTNPNADFLNAQIRSVIRESIPSFEDMRQLSQSLQQQQAALLRHIPSRIAVPSDARKSRLFFWGLLAGLFVASLIVFTEKFILP